ATSRRCLPGGAGDVVERIEPRIACGCAQHFFDADELIVLGDTVAAARRPRLDLASVDGNNDIRDSGVLGFAGSMRYDGGVAGALGHFNGIQRFGEGADLVHLDEDGVPYPAFDSLSESLGVGDEEVIPHELNAVAQALGEELPAVPVI